MREVRIDFGDDASGKNRGRSKLTRALRRIPPKQRLALYIALCCCALILVGSSIRWVFSGPTKGAVESPHHVVAPAELAADKLPLLLDPPRTSLEKQKAKPNINSEPLPAASPGKQYGGDGDVDADGDTVAAEVAEPLPADTTEPYAGAGAASAADAREASEQADAAVEAAAGGGELAEEPVVVAEEVFEEEEVVEQEEEGVKEEAEPAAVPVDSVWQQRAEEVKDTMRHAWMGYKKYAWGKDQLKPVSKGFEQWFDIGLTLIDALDTLKVMGLEEEFDEARKWVTTELDFDKDKEVNLFETTIRVLGGMLSTYHLTKDQAFLDKAIDLGDRLMSAFATSSGVPLSDVNLLTRKASGPKWSTKSSSSEVTTIQIEFKYLSKLTGDDKYRKAVEKVMEVVAAKKPADGLIAMWIDPHSGNFNGDTITLGARGDSYYEYLLKQWLQTGKTDDHMRDMYLQAVDSIRSQLVGYSEPSHYAYIAERQGGKKVAKMDHLVCFLAGTLALGAANGLGGGLEGEHMKLAKDLAEGCFQMYAQMPTGLAAEITMWNTAAGSTKDLYVKPADAHNLLRPETVESLFVLWRVTRDDRYREMGYAIYQAFEKYTRVESGGYSSLSNVKQLPPPKRDKMESFFLGETLKYLYLLFDEDPANCDLSEVVFNTEAHPLPIFDW